MAVHVRMMAARRALSPATTCAQAKLGVRLGQHHDQLLRAAPDVLDEEHDGARAHVGTAFDTFDKEHDCNSRPPPDRLDEGAAPDTTSARPHVGAAPDMLDHEAVLDVRGSAEAERFEGESVAAARGWHVLDAHDL